ncbi:MAG TPA: ABC transporter ATP-binding protein [Candidatus Thermoplasmatota archaeon]|nr:ABC transporter ATP-binding protein [Candidatus Thermoplasmatota archaeon]
MPQGHAVQTRQLRKAYRAGDQELEVLRGVDLDIRRGEFVSIMGPSGSGKSTLLNLVGLLDTPTGGAIRLMGTETHAMTPDQRARMRRQTLGFVFQSFNLMPRLTALQNVMLPMAIAGVPLQVRREKARGLLESVGLGDRIHHVPSELSGGQKQRVAIARALALDPPILLADEPTGNLDSATSAEVMQLFVRLHADGRTIIQVTHDDEMASFGTRTIRFRDGRIESQDHRPMMDFVEPSFFLAPPLAQAKGVKKLGGPGLGTALPGPGPAPPGTGHAAAKDPSQGRTKRARAASKDAAAKPVKRGGGR